MSLKKLQIYIVLMFTVFPAFDSRPFLQPISDCHSCIRDVYFSTLLPADKQWLCDICAPVMLYLPPWIVAETIPSGRYPVIPVFGAKPVMPYLTSPWVVWDATTKSGTTVFGTTVTIKGLPNPLVTDLLVPWKSDMKEFWARSRLARW